MAEDDWDGWKALTRTLGEHGPAGRRRPVRHQRRAPRPRHRRRRRQRDPDQGEPDRHAHRDPRRGADGPPRRLPLGDEPPLGRDRGHDHRRPRGRARLRADQDRLALPERSRRQVQPAPAHRGGARGRGALPGAERRSGAAGAEPSGSWSSTTTASAPSGSRALVEAVEPLGEVWVVAPEREQSAASHAISLTRPLRIRKVKPRWFAVDGTPTDCVVPRHPPPDEGRAAGARGLGHQPRSEHGRRRRLLRHGGRGDGGHLARRAGHRLQPGGAWAGAGLRLTPPASRGRSRAPRSRSRCRPGCS